MRSISTATAATIGCSISASSHATAPRPCSAGTGGCLLQIYLWQRGLEWKLVFDENVRAWKRIKAGGKPALLFHLHGSACNRVGYYDCRKTFVFDKGSLRPR